MKIVMVSNYLNHHQIPFSNEMYKLTDGNYHFIQTLPMEEERKKLGWEFDRTYPYLVRADVSDENRENALALINSADVVIHGSVSAQLWVQDRINQGKLTFLYAERIYKQGQWRRFSPNGRWMMQQEWLQFQDKNVYVLSASAYLPDDLRFFNAYKNKIYKWGYFPEFVPMNSADKEENSKIKIIWVARFIDWKHPEQVVMLAKRLANKGYEFNITMVGVGPLLSEIKKNVENQNLGNYFTFTGAITPEEVRRLMILSDIFIATSDYQEGWGAVINEAMNSQCAIVASHAMGAVPYLLTDNENALIYKSGNTTELVGYVEYLINNPTIRKNLAKKAYETIESMWSPQNAAQAFVKLSEALICGQEVNMKGVCGRAPQIKEKRMYKWLKECNTI